MPSTISMRRSHACQVKMCRCLMPQISKSSRCRRLPKSSRRRRPFAIAEAGDDLKRRMPLRTCGCSFCRRHGTRAVADPNGRLTISAPPNGLNRYRFGLRTADYLICRSCGAYVAAVISGNGEERATLNVTATAISELADRHAEPVDYDRETVEGRRAR